MDPDKALEQIRQLYILHRGTESARGDIGIILELIEDLDEWLGNGGFLPEVWRGAGRRHGLHMSNGALAVVVYACRDGGRSSAGEQR